MKKIFIILSLFCIFTSSAQQQSLFTNVTIHQYLYNPAYAGAHKGYQFNASYRHQYVGFDGAPKTIALSGYGTLKKHSNMAVGGLITRDNSGLLQRTSFYGSYSYYVKLGKKADLGFALSAGGVQYNVKIYNAKPYDKDDEFLKNNILNAGAFDANSGLYLQTKKFFMGISSNQMVNGKIYWENTIGKLTPHFYVFTGYTFTLDKKKKDWTIQPSYLMRFNQPSPFQMDFNLKAFYKDMVWIGSSYRSYMGYVGVNTNKTWYGSSLSMMLGTTISKQFTFAYSYDFTLNALKNYSSGSHELLFTYTVAAKKKKTASEKVLDADESEFNNIDNSMKSNIKHKKKEDHNHEKK